MEAKLKAELAEIEDELQNNNHEIQVILERQEQLNLQRQITVEKLRNLDQNKSTSRDLDSTDFPWSRKLEDAMKTTFKFDRLRPNQLQALNATLDERDCILIMPTGGGKSLCFQLPAIISKGITIVVSPLISLMEDQVMALKNIGVKAEMLSSGSSKASVAAILKEMTNEGTRLKLLYVTPERLAKSKRFMSKLEKMYELGLFSRLAVDEVHCCSQWGHDFRKDYKILGIFKRQFSKVPIIGLTATATARVTIDVQEMLNIQRCLVFRASFNRPNLFYKLFPKPTSQKEVSEELANLVKSYKGQSGIVYCLTIKEAEDVSKNLKAFNIEAMPYHAQLSSDLRSRIHKLWLSNSCQVVVATIAFGMGIDKPDVRFVIHYSLTRSIENYYQESGRAGRDDMRADCILFYRFGDIFRQSGMVFTESSGINHLYTMAAYCIEQTKCRRSILADHFGERWNESYCNKMCDICRQQSITGVKDEKEMPKVDITNHCKTLFKIIDAAALSNLKLTGLKLVEAWLGKKVTGFVMPKIEFAKFSQLNCEHIIVYLLLEGYLKEQFHYTPYSTISYLIKGPKASHVISGSGTIEIRLKSSLTSRLTVKSSTNNKVGSTSKLKDAKNSTTVSPKIKSEKLSKPNTAMAKASTLNNSSKHKSNDGDDTDSDLDFGNWNSGSSKKKKAKLDSDYVVLVDD